MISRQKNLVYTTPKSSLRSAFEIMQQENIRHLPVLDGETVVGIVSDRDMLSHTFLNPTSDPQGDLIPVQAVMSPNPISCRPNTPMAEIAEKMLEEKIDSIIVINESGRLVGLVTSSDILKEFINIS